jgi:hypothetical protein
LQDYKEKFYVYLQNALVARAQAKKSRLRNFHLESDRFSNVPDISNGIRSREIERGHEPDTSRRLDIGTTTSMNFRKEMKTPTFDGSCEISDFFKYNLMSHKVE